MRLIKFEGEIKLSKINSYVLKVNPQQVLDLNNEQRKIVKTFLFYAIHFTKRPNMLVKNTSEDLPITEREQFLIDTFYEIIQMNIIFKWIDIPSEGDLLDTMEEIELYLNHPTVEELKDHIEFYNKFHKELKFKNYELVIQRCNAWIDALNRLK